MFTSIASRRTWRTALVAVVCSLAVLSGPAIILAEESAQPPGAPAEKSGEPKAKGACPYSEDGTCCATCQEKEHHGQPQAEAEGGCPCQRAKKARQGS